MIGLANRQEITTLYIDILRLLSYRISILSENQQHRRWVQVWFQLQYRTRTDKFSLSPVPQVQVWFQLQYRTRTDIFSLSPVPQVQVWFQLQYQTRTDIFPLCPALQGKTKIQRKLGLTPALDPESDLGHLVFDQNLFPQLFSPKIKKNKPNKKIECRLIFTQNNSNTGDISKLTLGPFLTLSVRNGPSVSFGINVS